MRSRLKISIIIPTLNGKEFIDKSLTEIFRQTLLLEEVVIVDSGSTDGTVDVIKKYIYEGYPIRFAQISKDEFGHGKTRNYAAGLSGGDILVFLTQDAIPAHHRWLENLIKPFTFHDGVACVFGRHIPREDCNPLIERDIINHFDSFGKEPYVYQRVDWSDESAVEKYKDNKGWYCFNSTVNCAIRKSIWKKIRFREVLYAEDQLFGRNLIEKGYTKVYARDAAVLHSHNYSLLNFFKRYFDEYRGLNISLGDVGSISFFILLPLIVKGSVTDIRYIIKNTRGKRLYWCLYTPFFHFVRSLGAYLGGRYQRIPLSIQKILSLEKRGVSHNA